MTLSLHQGRVVMSSQITHTVIKIHPLAHILDTWALIFSSWTLFYSLSELHHVTASLPPLHVVTTRAREGGPKEHSAKQSGLVKLIQLHMYCTRALHSLRSFAQPPPSFLCCLSTFTPSMKPSPAQPRSSSYQSSTDFGHQHPSSHTVLIYSLYMQIPSQYSLMCSTR